MSISRYCRRQTSRVILLETMLMLSFLPAMSAVAASVVKDWFVQVVATKSTDLAVNDSLGILVVAQSGQADRHLSVYKLDAKGDLTAGKPSLFKLPRPAQLQKLINYPTATVFHPRLPILYVWQDIAAPKKDAPEIKTIQEQFDHLIVFAVANGSLRQIGAFARGAEFSYGHDAVASRIGLDLNATRLFLPNMLGPSAIGFYDLDEKGMPKKKPVPIQGSLDGYGLNKFEMKVTAVKGDVQALRALPTGWGFVAPTGQAVMFSSSQGLGLWEVANRVAPLAGFIIPTLPRDCLVGGDPGRGSVYVAGYQRGRVVRMAHAEGFPSLLPQTAVVSHGSFRSQPIVVSRKPAQLAIGGPNRVYLVELDDEGRFSDGREAVPVSGDVRCLAFSPKFKRLYVPVEKKQ